jgi:predicted phage terminase large subunit-like protein
VTRLNDKEKGVIILIMQRLHEDDLAGHVLSATGWNQLCLPAEAVEDEEIDLGHGRFHKRRQGDLLQPERESAKTLDRIKRDIGGIRYSAQYQQRPVPAEGNYVRRTWLKTYTNIPTGVGVRKVQSWDVATTTGETNDYSVCVSAHLHRGKFYITDVWRGRMIMPDLKRQIISRAQAMGVNVVLIEKAGLGFPLFQDLSVEHNEGMPRPIGIVPDGDKTVRLEGVTPILERGDLLLPEEAPWLADFLTELLGFPHNRHDDQVDALSQLLNWRNSPRYREPLIGTFGPIIIYG